jgi:hypothetical protein
MPASGGGPGLSYTGAGGPTRIITCANEAAGSRVRASNTAIAIFFTGIEFLQGLSVAGKLHSGLLK